LHAIEVQLTAWMRMMDMWQDFLDAQKTFFAAVQVLFCLG